MPAIDPVGELIAMLLRNGESRGLPMQASPGLRERMMQSAHSNPNARPDPTNLIDPLRHAGMPTTPPKISEDPWFNETPTSTQPSGRTITPGGQEFFIFGTGKNGQKVRINGPFKSEIEAQRELNSMRIHLPNSASQMEFSIGPWDSSIEP